MKDLNEAIAHCYEVAAAKCNEMNRAYPAPKRIGKREAECIKCSVEHLQLAAWLKELLGYRIEKLDRTIKLMKEVLGMSVDWDDEHYNAIVESIKTLEAKKDEMLRTQKTGKLKGNEIDPFVVDETGHWENADENYI